MKLARNMIYLMLSVCLLVVLTGMGCGSDDSLSLGESAILDDTISVKAVEYKISDHISCFNPCWPDGEYEFHPEHWATYLWVYFEAENIGGTPHDNPYVGSLYKGAETAQYTGYVWCENFDTYTGNTTLSPGELQEGWAIFQLPEDLDDSKVKVGIYDPDGMVEPPYWKLEP
jgi:hypothetical protein